MKISCESGVVTQPRKSPVVQDFWGVPRLEQVRGLTGAVLVGTRVIGGRPISHPPNRKPGAVRSPESG